MFWFDFCFPKAAEAVTGWRSSKKAIVDAKELYSVNHKASISQRVSAFCFISTGQVPLSKKSRNVLL